MNATTPTIRYTLHADGGFTCGDIATGITSYAYPSSPWATQAKRNAARTAATMLNDERRSPKQPVYLMCDYDARNWAALTR